MAAGAGDGDAEAETAEGAGDDGVGAAAFEGDGGGDAAAVGALRKRWRMPRRSPSPSSPTLAAKRMGMGGVIWAKRRAAAMARSAESPAALSQMPGAKMRGVSRSSTGFAGGSGGEDGVEVGGDEDAGSGGVVMQRRQLGEALPASSMWTLERPRERKRSRNQAARVASPKVGRGCGRGRAASGGAGAGGDAASGRRGGRR